MKIKRDENNAGTSRRRLLATVGTMAIPAVAGCDGPYPSSVVAQNETRAEQSVSITVTGPEGDTEHDDSMTLLPGQQEDTPNLPMGRQTVTVDVSVDDGPSASTEWDAGPSANPMLVRVRDGDVGFVEGGCDVDEQRATELHNLTDREVSGTITVERSSGGSTSPGRTSTPVNLTAFTPGSDGWVPVLEEDFTLASGTGPGAERRYCGMGSFEAGRVRVELSDGSGTVSRFRMNRDSAKLIVAVSDRSVDASVTAYCYPRGYCST